MNARMGTANIFAIVFYVRKFSLVKYFGLENSKFAFVKICGRSEQLKIKVFSFNVIILKG